MVNTLIISQIIFTLRDLFTIKSMNNDNTVGEIYYNLRINTQTANSDIQSFASTADTRLAESDQATAGISSRFETLAESITLAAGAVSSLSSVKSAISDVVDTYNDYEASLAGVKAVAQATGNDIAESLQVVKSASEDGLVSQSDAAAAVKNLEQFGFSAQQAEQAIRVMTDAAVYNRQANYTVSEAVRVTTEGIRMENSVLSDASGITKNVAKMYEDYADSVGKNTKELSNSEKVQAIMNGVLEEGGIFSGNAEQYTNSLAGAQQRFGTEVNEVKAKLGGMFERFSPIISGITDWISENRTLVGALVVLVGILVGGGGVIMAVTSVAKAISTMGIVGKVATGGLLGLAVAGAGIAAALMISDEMNKTIDSMNDTGEAANNSTNDINNNADAMRKQAEQAEKTAKKIAKLNKQLNELTRDYRRDLKEIAVKHEENLADLTQQIEDANIEYRQALNERYADFNESLAKQERTHQEMVDELMGQLAFLQRYNNEYNRQKLAQVQFALAKEQQLYSQETEAQRAELELQNMADKERLDKKLASLQQEQAEEVAFMEKHRDTLNSVRDVILLDEIESLQERYEAQKASYQEQITEAKISGNDIGSTLGDNVNQSLEDELNKDYSDIGKDIGKSIIDGLGKGIQEAAAGFGQWISEGGPASFIWKMILGEEGYRQATGQKYNYKNGGGSWSSGGYTGRGPADEVAGVVHKGEYVIPANQVNQSTGLPKSAGGNNTFVINLSGVLATSMQSKRELADELVQALKQTQQSRLGKGVTV